MEINDKTSYKDLKSYIKNNGFQKVYLKEKSMPYTKSTKQDLLSFIKEKEKLKEMENNVDSIFGNTIIDTEEVCSIQPKEDSDEIEQIPIFKNELNNELNKIDTNNDDLRGIKLNKAQTKVKRYITRFPDKLHTITSRSTFKSDFAKLRDNLNEDECKELYSKGKTKQDIDQINEDNHYLLNEIEQTLNSANIGGLIKDQVFVTVSLIEDIIRFIRKNEDKKIPSYIVDTIGNLRIDGLSVVLDARPDFHDCLDELLIKYDDYGSLLSCISVEKRILLIILGAAVMTHKINVQQEKELNTSKKKDVNQSKFSGL